MSADPVDFYRRLLGENTASLEAVCVTYARGADADGMIRAFGGDPADAPEMTLDEHAEEMARHRYGSVPQAVLVTCEGDWLVSVEDNGFQGSRPEVLRPLSRDAPAMSVFWNVNGANEFAYAVNGRKAVSFDMNHPGERHGADAHLLDREIDALPFGLERQGYPAGLTLAERLTGVRITGELLSRRFRRAVLTPVPADLVPDALAGHPVLAEPLIRRLLADPSAEALPAVRLRIAESIADDAGIAGEPLIAEVLDVLARSAEPSGALRQRLLDRFDEHLSVVTTFGAPVEARSAALQLAHAVADIAAELGPDPDRSRRRLPKGGYRPRQAANQVRIRLLRRIAPM